MILIQDYTHLYKTIRFYKCNMGFCYVSQCWQLPDPPEKTRTLRDSADDRRSTYCEAPGKIMNTLRPDAWFLVSRTLLWQEDGEMESWNHVKTKMLRFDLLSLGYYQGTSGQFSLTRDAMSMSGFLNDLASTCHDESSHSDAVRSLSSANPSTLRTAWHDCCRFAVHCEK